MPDLCFYAPWIMKEPIPDPFRMMLEKAGKKRISYDEADCSMRNIRKQGKVSRLHGPTLHALLTLIQERKRLWCCRYTKGQGYHKLFLHGISWKTGKVCNDL